jgi:hypothetical protein
MDKSYINEAERKSLCNIYGEENLIMAEIIEGAKKEAFAKCSLMDFKSRSHYFNGCFFSEDEIGQLSHFAKQGVKVRLK